MRYEIQLAVKGLVPTNEINLVLEKPKSFLYIGQITVHCTKKGFTSGNAFGVAATKAMESGGNILLVENEGANPNLGSSAFGLSLGGLGTSMVVALPAHGESG